MGTVRQIPEVVVEGRRLGRHVNHDDRSLQYLIPEGTPVTVKWERVAPVFDQGDVGSCTGNACTGILGTQPDDGDLSALLAAGLVLDEAEALTLYSAAETIDGDGPYPPNDNGSSGLSVAKAAKAAGLCSGYTHATSVAAAHTAIQAGPFMIGSDWYTSMDEPNAYGVVEIAADATIRGGHEYEAVSYLETAADFAARLAELGVAAPTADLPGDLWELVNSWGESFGIKGHFFYSTATFTKLLADDGDVTALVPLSQPAPVPVPPTPVPTPEPTPPTPTPPTPPEPTPVPVPDPSTGSFEVEVHLEHGEGQLKIPVERDLITGVSAKSAHNPLAHPAVTLSSVGDETLVSVSAHRETRLVICTLAFSD